MYARIIQGRVAELFDEMPTLGSTECALIMECDEVTQVGWPMAGGQIYGPETDVGMELAIMQIVEAYDIKRKGLKDRIAVAMLQDGETEVATRAALAAEWQQVNADEELEILSLLGG